MPDAIDVPGLTEVEIIGENDHGYRFYVGRLNGEWIGFSLGDLDDGRKMMCLLPEVSVAKVVGIEDRDLAIRMVSALAENAGSGFGGIARWFVEEKLRGDPEEFRCSMCDQLFCDGTCYDSHEPDLP